MVIFERGSPIYVLLLLLLLRNKLKPLNKQFGVCSTTPRRGLNFLHDTLLIET